jgi:hypothetical protein
MGLNTFQKSKGSLQIGRGGAVTATSVDQVTLLGCSANATATAAERGTAALGLALVILEDEHVVGASLGSKEGLVGSLVAPLGKTVFGCLAETIVGSDRLIRISGRSSILEIVHKSLHTELVAGIIGKSGKHEHVRDQKKAKCNQEECDTRIHLFYLFFLK